MRQLLLLKNGHLPGFSPSVKEFCIYVAGVRFAMKKFYIYVPEAKNCMKGFYIYRSGVKIDIEKPRSDHKI